MNARRNFLKQSALLTTGLAMNPSEFLKRKTAVGIQLYTLRDDIVKDVKGVIGVVAAAGYREVETYGLSDDGQFFGLSVKDFAQLLKSHNLKSPSGHYMPSEMLFDNGNGDDVKKICDVANTLGQQYIIMPFLEEDRRKTIDQYKAIAVRMNKAGEICKAANLQLAYHNHDFEFLQINGQRGYDILMNDTNEDLLKFELDLYWVVMAGLDPLDLFKQQPGRFHLVHVKDMDKSDRSLNTEIGNGSIDFKPIIVNAKLGGIKHYYLEQENNYVPDRFTSVQNSFSFIRKNLLK